MYEGPAVRASELRKVYPGGAVALDGIDLEVAQGEFVFLLGRSGAGKTGLDALFGLRPPALKAWRNALIPSAVRATVVSVLSTVAFLGSTFILAVMTPVSDSIGLNGVMLAAAGLAVLSGISLVTAQAWEGSGHAHRLSL